MASTDPKPGIGLVLAIGVLVFAAVCYGDKPYPHLGVEDVQVVPRKAEGPENATRKFQLSAWYRDRAKNAQAGPGPLSWSLDLDGGTVDRTGAVSISRFPASGAERGQVRISRGFLSDALKLTLWANPEAATAAGDVIELAEAEAEGADLDRAVVDAPGIAVVETSSSGECRWSRPLAFVGALSVGEQTEVPCSVSLFSPGSAMLFQDRSTTDLRWLEKGARFTVTPGKPLPVNITVFLAVTPQAEAQPAEELLPLSPRELAELDVQRANLIFETSRAGLRLEAEYRTLKQASDLPIKIGADPYDCVSAFELPSDPDKDDYAYNPSRISVYYVDRINYPPDPVHPRVRGIQCHHWYSGNPKVGDPPGRGPVVFISYSHHSPVTLAHEIGHALGLNDVEDRLGNRDVMHNLLPDGPLGADARSHLTIGQVFRMNVWDDSWINTRMPKPPQRACDTRQPCPAEELDPDGD